MAVSHPSVPHIAIRPAAGSSLSEKLNTRWHERGLQIFMVIVLGHWSEHLVQAYQIYVMHWPRPMANGILGLWYPWLIKSEALHYGYALVMLIGIWIFRKGFTGVSHTWWMIAFWIQFWHHIEHFLLIYQATTHHNFWASRYRAACFNWCSRGSSCIFSTTQSCSFRWSSACTTICSRPRVSTEIWHARANGAATTRQKQPEPGTSDQRVSDQRLADQRMPARFARHRFIRPGLSNLWLDLRRRRFRGDLLSKECWILIGFACALTLFLVGCSSREESPSAVAVDYEFSPRPPRAGPATVTIKLADRSAKPITGASIQVEADMTHAGMSPVFANAKEAEPGRYEFR